MVTGLDPLAAVAAAAPQEPEVFRRLVAEVEAGFLTGARRRMAETG
ncbi:hypothetical protein [Methylobrevis pamukkalensis]|nr:hypothetical protein [Methylobrevis pamukkalensis]